MDKTTASKTASKNTAALERITAAPNFPKAQYRCNRCGIVTVQIIREWEETHGREVEKKCELDIHCPKCGCVLWEAIAQRCDGPELTAEFWKSVKAYNLSLGIVTKPIPKARVPKAQPGAPKPRNPIKTCRPVCAYKDVAHLLTVTRTKAPQDNAAVWAERVMSDAHDSVNAALRARHHVTDEEFAWFEELVSKGNRHFDALSAFPSFIPVLLKVRAGKSLREAMQTQPLNLGEPAPVKTLIPQVKPAIVAAHVPPIGIKKDDTSEVDGLRATVAALQEELQVVRAECAELRAKTTTQTSHPSQHVAARREVAVTGNDAATVARVNAAKGTTFLPGTRNPKYFAALASIQ